MAFSDIFLQTWPLRAKMLMGLSRQFVSGAVGRIRHDMPRAFHMVYLIHLYRSEARRSLKEDIHTR